MSDDQNSWVSLRSPHLAVEVNPLGAQLSALRDCAGRDLLWDGNAAIWNGRAPILFPIVGALAGGRYRLGPNSYPLPRHGFARGKMFAVTQADTAAATFRLSSDDATVQVYPFNFELDVRFTLHGSALDVTASVRNKGAQDMPASLGFHPAFRWPLPYGRARAGHYIEFEKDEPAAARRLNTDGLLAPDSQPTPIVDRRLVLTDALFQDDALILDQVRSRSVTYGAQDGPRIRVSYPDAPYLGLWTKPGSGFICIEPWHGIADPAGYSGDLRHKPGVFSVAPGEAWATQMTVELLGSE